MVTIYNSSASGSLLMDLSGEMMYISAFGQDILVINSQRVAIDLLEKRSNIYSDRQHRICVGDFTTKNLALFITPYGDLYALTHCLFTHADLPRLDGAVSVVSPWEVSPSRSYRTSTLSRVARPSSWRLS